MDGNIGALTFIHRNGKIQSFYVSVGWREGGMPEIKGFGSNDLEEIRLTEKYIYGLSFVNYNMLVTNWDASNAEEILMPCMFEDIYPIYTKEPFKTEGGGAEEGIKAFQTISHSNLFQDKRKPPFLRRFSGFSIQLCMQLPVSVEEGAVSGAGFTGWSSPAPDQAEGQEAGKGRKKGGKNEFFGCKQFLHKR
jgi:hypothetical protein